MSDKPYIIIVGMEIHAQCNTKTKMFCGCDNESFGVDPNTNICEVCAAFPGTLPVANEEAIKKTIATALAFKCQIAEQFKFDRKNYFYPDLPAGYQISQYDMPIGIGGQVDILLDGEKKTINLTRIHLECDAGKLIHTAGGSLVDFNRAGTPLMEIVSEPDMTSAVEAKVYCQEIQNLVRVVDSSNANIERGEMRLEANVNIKFTHEGKEVRTPITEIKNMSSFRMVEKAIEYEAARHYDEWLAGGEICNRKSKETRGWDDAKNVTVFQRSKEEAHDYRYFPEPDLPPFRPNRDLVEELKAHLPELPVDKKMRYMQDFGLSFYDADLIVNNPQLTDFFEEVAKESGDSKKSANWLTSVVLADQSDLKKIKPQILGALIKMINEGKISNSVAKDRVYPLMRDGRDPQEIVEKEGLAQVSDESELKTIVQKIIDANPGPVAEIKEGKEKAISFLVGQIMRQTGGKANPQMINNLIKELIR